MSENEDASRRHVILGVAAAGVAVPVLAACGSSGRSDSGGDVQGEQPTDSPTDTGSPSHGSKRGTTIKASEIPVGSGRIFPDQQIVVTQPTAGEYKAFSAVCTHQGCIVSSISHQQIECGCHFSRYSIADGHVEGGPAPKPLPEKSVTVSGDTLTVS